MSSSILDQQYEREFLVSLLRWHRHHGRHDLPWRRDNDPYHILVSELMLQQTQVSRVIPKYEAFLKRFPTLNELAVAPRTEVLRYWQGLGYNSRAIRLHELAIKTVESGIPEDRASLLLLPGIGPYTAGAIRIFAYDEPDTSVDVNVRRVLSRVFVSRDTPIGLSEIETRQSRLSYAVRSPREFHGALMDFGATICTARSPGCGACPLQSLCQSNGPRPEEQRNAAVSKQPRFHGSNRWWRGRVLREILRGPQISSRLPAQIVPAAGGIERLACAQAIEQLITEGIARRVGKHIRVRE